MSPEPAGAEELIRRLNADHGAALLGWARKRLADPRDAEELVSETLVRAWRHQDQFDPSRGSERSWLFGILRNAAVDSHRRASRRLRLVTDTELADEVDWPSDADRIAETTVIREALMDLSEAHREVIIEAFYSDNTCAQIASRLGIPEGTVKSRLYYGMRALRASLEERGLLQ